MWRNISSLLTVLLLLALGASRSAYAEQAKTPEVTLLFLQHYIQQDQLMVNAKARIKLSDEMINALQHGVALYFRSRIQLWEPSLFMGLLPYNRTISQHTTLARLRFNPMDEHWHLVNETKQRKVIANTLQEAMDILGTFTELPLANIHHLHPGIQYKLAWHIQLDRTKLPTPLWLTTLKNPQWHLSSDWLIKPVDPRKPWQR